MTRRQSNTFQIFVLPFLSYFRRTWFSIGNNMQVHKTVLHTKKLIVQTYSSRIKSVHYFKSGQASILFAKNVISMTQSFIWQQYGQFRERSGPRLNRKRTWKKLRRQETGCCFDHLYPPSSDSRAHTHCPQLQWSGGPCQAGAMMVIKTMFMS